MIENAQENAQHLSDNESDTFSLDEEDMLNNLMSQKMKEFQISYGLLSPTKKDTDSESEADEAQIETESSTITSKEHKKSTKSNANTTVFHDPTQKYSRSETVESKNSSIALTLKEHKQLKRKRTEEMQQELQEKKKKKKAKFRAETYLKDQDENQMQLRKYYFEMKSVLLKDTMTEDEYNTFLRKEYEKQGLEWKGPIVKNQHKNYKELKQELTEKKQHRKLQRQKMMGMGTLTSSDLKKEKREEQIRKQKELIKFNTRFGAPGSLGQEDKRMFRTKALGKGVGKYRKGMLMLSEKEIKSVSRGAQGRGR